MGGLPFPPKNCSAVDPLNHHRMHYSMLTVKHEAVQLVKLEELVMNVCGVLHLRGVLHLHGVLQSEYQFLLPVIRNDFVCLLTAQGDWCPVWQGVVVAMVLEMYSAGD